MVRGQLNDAKHNRASCELVGGCLCIAGLGLREK